MLDATFDDLAETLNDDERPPLDRSGIDTTRLSAEQLHWREHGYVILKSFIPNDLIDAYSAARAAHGEWHEPSPYLRVPEIRNLCLYRPLLDKLHALIGEELAMHLNLTGWVSTERNWHQDDYLNPPLLNGHYAAVWFALDAIHPDSGPFQFVPGSHRWPALRGSKVRRLLPLRERFKRNWPSLTQSQVAGLLDREITERGARVAEFIGAKGDVLIWHSCLAHRGSEPRARGMPRKSLITHYASIEKALHFPAIRKHGEGWYFAFGPRFTNRPRGWIRRLFGLRHRITA